MLILGDSLSEFMRTLGVYSSAGGVANRLRNQMDRLFNAHVSMIYEDERGKAGAQWARTRWTGAGLWPQPLGSVLLRGRGRMGRTDRRKYEC